LRKWRSKSAALKDREIDRPYANSAGWRVQNSQEADIIITIHESSQVRQDVFDLASIEKAVPTYDSVRYPGPAQLLFKQSRLRVQAEEDREIAPLRPVMTMRCFNRIDDVLGLFKVIRHFEQLDLFSSPSFAPK
jgi:hypothetical protein